MITMLSAPSNLGLRPPEPGSVPGAAKAPEALREAGLFARFAELGATDSGVILAGRYVDDDARDRRDTHATSAPPSIIRGVWRHASARRSIGARLRS